MFDSDCIVEQIFQQYIGHVNIKNNFENNYFYIKYNYAYNKKTFCKCCYNVCDNYKLNIILI